MRRLATAALMVIWVAVVLRAQSVTPAPAPQTLSVAHASDAASQQALVNRYCVVCHNAKLKTANLLLDGLDLAHLGDHAEIGEKVVRKLRAGMMPPTGMPRPDPATLESLIGWMENELDRSAAPHLPAARPSPPQPHRVRERDSRPARARSGCHEVPAARRLDARASTTSPAR